jgi:hypothetical protein
MAASNMALKLRALLMPKRLVLLAAGLRPNSAAGLEKLACVKVFITKFLCLCLKIYSGDGWMLGFTLIFIKFIFMIPTIHICD